MPIFDKILEDTSGQTGALIILENYYSGALDATATQQYKDAIARNMAVGGQDITYDASKTNPYCDNCSYGGYYSTKYCSYFSAGTYKMFCHMLTAEVYLILAEASARANSAVPPEALFVTYTSSVSLSQFLTAVRYEKLAELYDQGGETWYDLIRYDYLDGFGSGFQVSDVKPEAKNPEKFILPIPAKSIDASNHVIKQNPSSQLII